MKLIVSLTSLLLTACATDAALVKEAPPPSEIKVVIRIPCVKPEDIPRVPPTAMPKNGDIKQKAAGATSDVLALEDYALRADALLQACARAK